jgi:oxaloacetate decarboxylase (Na+ extruding) subunit alpha
VEETPLKQKAKFIDVTLRDGHQCLWSTRMSTAQMAPVLNKVDSIGYDIVNIMGGAVFDVMVRFLRENPWQRMRFIADHVRTPLDALTRGVSLYTFEMFSDEVIALNSKVLADCGIKVLTVYDALNDNSNIRSSVDSARAEGLKVNAMITYALSPVHSDEYFVARAKELRAMKVDYISVKDPTGLLTPERAQTLFPKLVEAVGSIPMQLHSHCQTGLAPKVYEEAIRAGFEYFYTAARPLANGASLPDTREISEIAQRLGCEVSIEGQSLKEYEDYWEWIAFRDGKPTGAKLGVDQALYQHQIPGGMISNLRSQLSDMGMSDRFGEILEEIARVRVDLGYPILVSPFAQYIVTQSVLNVVQGERFKSVPDEVKRYACGFYGKLAASPSDEFLERANLDEFRKREERQLAKKKTLADLRQICGHGASDGDLLLAAFYSRDLTSALHPALPLGGYSDSPLVELIRFCTDQVKTKALHLRMAETPITMSTP